MRKCTVCNGTGKNLIEGKEYTGATSITTFELGVCSWCMGRGTLNGD